MTATAHGTQTGKAGKSAGRAYAVGERSLNLELPARQDDRPVKGWKDAARMSVQRVGGGSPGPRLKLLLELSAACEYRHALERLSPRTRKIRQSLATVSQAITDMLGYGRMADSHFDHCPALIDLAYVVGQALETSAHLSDSRNIPLLFFRDEPITLWADGRRINEAAAILVGYFLRRARRGSRILCSLSKAHGFARISVSDDGYVSTGCEVELAAHPFAREIGQDCEVAAPESIRLWKARLIAERHGGTLSAASDETGDTAELILELPLRQI